MGKIYAITDADVKVEIAEEGQRYHFLIKESENLPPRYSGEILEHRPGEIAKLEIFQNPLNGDSATVASGDERVLRVNKWIDRSNHDLGYEDEEIKVIHERE